MTSYDTRKTADYSPFLVHFVRDGRFTSAGLISSSEPLRAFLNTPAFERMLNIIRTGRIYASPMPHLPNNPRAVCFTECIWGGLVQLADQYSPFGFVVSKRTVFRKGGGPALYVRGNTLRSIWATIPRELEPFIAPFDPDAALTPGMILDWVHEREWRLPSDFEFEDGYIEYLIVNTIENANTIVETFGTERFLRRKIIVMEVYRTIREAWG